MNNIFQGITNDVAKERPKRKTKQEREQEKANEITNMLLNIMKEQKPKQKRNYTPEAKEKMQETLRKGREILLQKKKDGTIRKPVQAKKSAKKIEEEIEVKKNEWSKKEQELNEREAKLKAMESSLLSDKNKIDSFRKLAEEKIKQSKPVETKPQPQPQSQPQSQQQQQQVGVKIPKNLLKFLS